MITDAPASSGDEQRFPCPLCQAPILVGARKCPSCRRWLDAKLPSTRRRPWMFAALVGLVATAGALALARRRPSPVGEAPPLTPMTKADNAAAAASGEPSPAAIGPTPEPAASESPVGRPGELGWRTRSIRVDVHPLDAVFSDDGNLVYASGDDAKIRAYEVTTGKLVRVLAVPAQGDRLKLLHGRYLAVIRREEAPHSAGWRASRRNRRGPEIHLQRGSAPEAVDGRSFLGRIPSCEAHICRAESRLSKSL